MNCHTAADVQVRQPLGKADIGALVVWKRLRADIPWAAALMSVPDAEVRTVTAQAGVGVALHEPAGSPRWLLEPAPYRPARYSAAQWLFHEQAWRQLGPDRS
ncbi:MULTISPECIES: hypothetical protein [unclassified Streptomyces]|uniref:hypothetical protein n=1 Tax=unclassified Streptomyces TaxID=2593676 RepID=UPI000F79C940|nr:MULTISPECIES: hypothetical protein [unclassified Streptomyces]